MARKKKDHLFAPDKVGWMLEGGLETMDGGELQILLAMAETKLQSGYKPEAEEKKVVERLRALTGEGARDIKRQVRNMVKGRTKAGSTSLSLPPVFDRLIKRLTQDSKK